MVREKAFHLKIRNGHIGPGGWPCPCCSPSPKNRKPYVRKMKRGEEKRLFSRLIKDEMDES